MALETWQTGLEMAVAAISIISIPVFLWRYFVSTREQIKANDRSIYESLDDYYARYLTLAAAYPQLDVGEFPLQGSPSDRLTPAEQAQQDAIFSLLLSTFEKAFVLYSGASKGSRQRQWDGWDDYIRSYFDRPNFVAFLDRSRGHYVAVSSHAGMTMDNEFEAYLKTVRLSRSELA